MAKIKHTKNELKAQNEALTRYQRFLPMLQLKKQQLQSEIQMISHQIAEKEQEFQTTMDGLKQWVTLFSEPLSEDWMVTLDKVHTDVANIAGVNIPVLKSVAISKQEPDLFETPAWVDDAQDVMESLLGLKSAIHVLQQQRSLIEEELRMTSQRVNLFEKIKIPECRENIRIIKIYLGDEQTAAVARGKLAKQRTQRSPESVSQEMSS